MTDEQKPTVLTHELAFSDALKLIGAAQANMKRSENPLTPDQAKPFLVMVAQAQYAGAGAMAAVASYLRLNTKTQAEKNNDALMAALASLGEAIHAEDDETTPTNNDGVS